MAEHKLLKVGREKQSLTLLSGITGKPTQFFFLVREDGQRQWYQCMTLKARFRHERINGPFARDLSRYYDG